MGEVWRLIIDQPCSGPYNMALDEALAQYMNNYGGAPILRLYGWSPQTLSLGQFQKTGGIDLDYLANNSIDLVRRPTGGRAILHGAEVTYAVILPETSPLYGSLRFIYENISRALMIGLQALGVQFDQIDSAIPKHNRRNHYSTSDVCFATRVGHELSCGGAKITAGAQRRFKRASLQHGSIPLTMDRERYLDCFVWSDDARRKRSGNMMGSLQESIGSAVEPEVVHGTLIDAFEKKYRIKFERSGPTSIELETAMDIMDEKMSE